MTTLLQLDGISKSFSGINVLDKVKLEMKAGSVIGLAGENGAGKSTLMKIITGVYSKDEGRLQLRGEEKTFNTPRQAMDAGIAIIHQELNLLPDLSVAENIFLGREPKGYLGLINQLMMREKTMQLMQRLNQKISPDKTVGNLSIAQQQMVEIARALSFDADVIIMDEPTDALSERESEILFQVVNDLKSQGKALAYISHRLQEIFKLCDEVAVLRDGSMVHIGPTQDIDEDELIRHMVGRTLSEKYPYTAAAPGDTRLRVEHIHAPGVNDFSFSARAGEVIGFSGLAGAGRTELARALYGMTRISQGVVEIDGTVVSIHTPGDAVNAGVGYVTEDRKGEGLIQDHGLRSNMTLSALPLFQTKYGLIDRRREIHAVHKYVEAFSIKMQSSEMPIAQLSGGNQQKVSIAKTLIPDPRIIILDEPTRGVDVGAKREIYLLIQQLKEQGLCILLMSSDLPEILGISDRIMVVARGHVSAEFTREEADQEKIMHAAVA